MAARTRRTRFAASFVVVIAGSACSHDAKPTGAGTGTGTSASSPVEPMHMNPPGNPPPPPDPVDAAPAAPRKIAHAWNVSKNADGSCEGFDDGCTAMQRTPGEPIPPCNPPPSRAMVCPSPMDAGYVEIVTYDGTSCVVMDSNTPIACPQDAPAKAAFVGRRWSINATDTANVCSAEPQVDCDPAIVHHTCNPPAPSKVKCPPYSAGHDVREVSQDKCETLLASGGGGHCPAHMHCNPPPPRDVEVPCPPP